MSTTTIFALDETDQTILDMLREDARRPCTDIARDLDIPDTSAGFRIKRMVENGVIKKFTIVTRDDPPPEMNAEAIMRLINTTEATTKETRKEIDLLWAGLRACTRQIESMEKKNGSMEGT